MKAAIFRAPKVQPCHICGPTVCKFYPCEDVLKSKRQNAIDAPKGAKE